MTVNSTPGNVIEPENIKEVYNSIRESLKFVEAKNAGLIAINCGAMFGLVTVYKEINTQLHWSLFIILLLLSISTLLILWSFFPRMSVKRKTTPPAQSTPNLFFSEKVASLSPQQLRDVLAGQATRVQDDMLAWTHATAGVAARKYRLFRTAVLLSILALAVAIVAALKYTLCILITL